MEANKYNPVYIYVRDTNEIVAISEGSGDNLLEEDKREGYKDYIYYTQYEMSGGMIDETDGGMVMLKTFFGEKYSCTEEAIPEVLDMAYGSSSVDYMILRRKDED